MLQISIMVDDMKRSLVMGDTACFLLAFIEHSFHLDGNDDKRVRN